MQVSLTLPPYTHETPEPIESLAPTTDLVVHVDGSCQPNPGRMGIGVAIFMRDELLWQSAEFAGENGTNNEAEYHAFVYAAKAVQKLQAQFPQFAVPCTFVSDSRLAVNAFKQLYNPTNPKFGVLFDRFMQLCGRLSHQPKILWVPRKKNRRADTLSKAVQQSVLAAA